ncbi:MAG: tetratricopeptide repeat protein [Symploca sp. SIO2G7]|nr:tetratricopeptide repeat protein [Symploca sp. SIO2G7]
MTNPSKEFWYYAHKGETLRELAGNLETPSPIRLGARESFNRALELEPDNMWVIAHRGLVERQLGNWDEAIKAFEKVKENSPGDPWAYAQLGETYRLKLARTSISPQDPLAKKAIKNFDEAINQYENKEYLWAHAHLGATYFHIRELDKALSHLDKAIDLADKSYAWAWAYKAGVYYQQGKYVKARACMETAKDLDPRVISSVGFQLALLTYLNGETDRAIELFNRELQEDVDNTLALYGIALVTIRTKEVNEARSEIDKALAALLEQDNSATRYMLAALAYLQDQNDQASEHIQSAIAATDRIQDILESNEVSESIRQMLINVQSGNLSWLGLDCDQGFQDLISQAT